jgi:negative regulator of flagellin synthesis FlgM
VKVGSRKPTTTSSTKLQSTSGASSVGSNKASSASSYNQAGIAPDQVNIQSQGSQLLAMEQQMADISVIDIEKVNAIKNAIAQGQFNVDAERVADRLLEVAREHLLSTSGRTK